jgi:hypothetical protein
LALVVVVIFWDGELMTTFAPAIGVPVFESVTIPAIPPSVPAWTMLAWPARAASIVASINARRAESDTIMLLNLNFT